MEPMECFRWEQEGQVAHIIMCRPEKRNTMTIRFFRELRSAIERADSQEDIRAVVLSGEGRGFTAGLDLNEAAGLWKDPTARSRRDFLHTVKNLQDAVGSPERCRKPVIAAVHGYCIGGGVDLTSACDIRLASHDTVFSIRETRVAIVADLGTLQRMASIVEGRARELALTGRDFTAVEALQIGFVTHLYPDRETLIQDAMRMAEDIAALSPLAVQGVKETLNFTKKHGAEAGLEYVAQKNAALIPSEDLVEAFSAFMQKRKPVYRGL